MKTTTATSTYEIPQCNVLEINMQNLVCTSTEGYSLNPNRLDEDDWQ